MDIAGALNVQGTDITNDTDSQAVRERFDNNPRQFIASLEALMTAEQLTALESTLFPEPDDPRRKRALEAARLVLLRAGVSADNSAVLSLDAETP